MSNKTIIKIAKILIILSPILAGELAYLTNSAGPDNFLAPLGIFIGIPFILIVGLFVEHVTRNMPNANLLLILGYLIPAIFVCFQQIAGIMLF